MKLINPLVILRILSTILFLETVCFLLCLPVALVYKEDPYPFIWSALSTLSLSVVFFIVSWKVRIENISNREGFLSVTAGWLAFTCLGTLPFIFSGALPSFVDAFFETASGFSTTGASVIGNVEILPQSVIFWRSFTHWIGGLGIIVLVILILPSLRITAQNLLFRESSLKEKTHPKTKAVGLRLLYIYLGLTLSEVLLLMAGDLAFFDSLCLTFGTVATGGFAIKNSGVTAYSSYIQYIIGLFMFLSGVSFVVYYHFIKLNFRKITGNEELRFYAVTTLLAGTLATAVLLANTNKSFEPAFREGFFQVISFITTTGFSTADYLMWPVAGQFLMFLLLFTGASTGSTTGGIKMLRHLVVVKNIRSAYVKLVHPKTVSHTRIFNKPVSEQTNVSILSFIILYLVIFITGSFIIVISGVDLVTGVSAVAASLGNVGPAFGTAGPMSNFAHFSGFNKIFLSLLMIIGRLEIYTVFVLFARSFWRL